MSDTETAKLKRLDTAIDELLRTWSSIDAEEKMVEAIQTLRDAWEQAPDVGWVISQLEKIGKQD